MKAPEGYITGNKVGDIIVKELERAGFERYGSNYRKLFGLVRKFTPTTDNGQTGRSRRIYYEETRVISLCRRLFEEQPGMFEEDRRSGGTTDNTRGS